MLGLKLNHVSKRGPSSQNWRLQCHCMAMLTTQWKTDLDRLDALDSAIPGLSKEDMKRPISWDVSVVEYTWPTMPCVATNQFEMNSGFAQPVEISIARARGANFAFRKDIQLTMGTKNGDVNFGPQTVHSPTNYRGLLTKYAMAHHQLAQWYSTLQCVMRCLMPHNMAEGVPYEPDSILKLVCSGWVSDITCRGGKCGCMVCQFMCTIFCHVGVVKYVWVPSIHA